MCAAFPNYRYEPTVGLLRMAVTVDYRICAENVASLFNVDKFSFKWRVNFLLNLVMRFVINEIVEETGNEGIVKEGIPRFETDALTISLLNHSP